MLQDVHKSIARIWQQKLTSMTQYNTAQAKWLKKVYKPIKTTKFQLFHKQVTSYSSEDKILARNTNSFWKTGDNVHEVKGSRLQISLLISSQQPKVLFLLPRSSEFSWPNAELPPSEVCRTQPLRQKRFWKFYLHVILCAQPAAMIMYPTPWPAEFFAE